MDKITAKDVAVADLKTYPYRGVLRIIAKKKGKSLGTIAYLKAKGNTFILQEIAEEANKILKTNVQEAA